jgi:hypothetical protein
VGVTALANRLSEPAECLRAVQAALIFTAFLVILAVAVRAAGATATCVVGERQRAKKWRLVAMPSQAEATPVGEPPARFTPGSLIGSPKKEIENPMLSDDGEPGEP